MVSTFEIVDAVGGDHSSTLYNARESGTGAPVTLRVFEVPRSRSEATIKRLRTLFQAVRYLDHAAVLRVRAIEVGDFGVCVVTDRREGETLASQLPSMRNVSVTGVCTIFQRVLAALVQAHHIGIIHHELKPANILLAPSGAQVMNFGLEKITEDSSNTMVLGSERDLIYKSPEHIRGSKAKGELSDLYSVGIMMYEVLAGRPAFANAKDDFLIRQRIVEGAIPPPRQANPAIPKDLARVIVRAIDRDPAKRFQSAGEMLAALEKASPAAGGGRGLGWGRRILVLLVALAVVAALLIAYRFFLH